MKEILPVIELAIWDDSSAVEHMVCAHLTRWFDSNSFLMDTQYKHMYEESLMFLYIKAQEDGKLFEFILLLSFFSVNCEILLNDFVIVMWKQKWNLMKLLKEFDHFIT